MKKVGALIGALIMTGSVAAKESYEMVNTKFSDGVSYEEQHRSMLELNAVVSAFEGFKSRNFYYSQDDNRWVDIVVWENNQLAKSASVEVMNNPIAMAVFAKMDFENSIFSYYERIGELNSSED